MIPRAARIALAGAPAAMPGAMRIAAWTTVALVAGVALAGCPGSRRGTAPGSGAFLGDTHAAPGHAPGPAGRGSQRPLSLAEARDALARALEQGAHRDVIRHANQVIRAGGALDADAERAVVAAVDALPAAELEALHGELDAAAMPAPLVALRLAFIAEHSGDDVAARRWLERAPAGANPAGANIDEALAARSDALRQRMDARAKVDPAVIAVLLPRTGPYARLGAALEAGVRFAARVGGRGVTLRFIDTAGGAAGDDDQAALAVDRAVFEHRALAILGPVGERESLRAAARAAELGVPIALLSPGEDGASPDSGVFRLWSSPRWEAAEAARLAMYMGYDRLAVLAPRDEHGALATEAFVRAARDAGARVVATGTYDPTATDLEPDIKTFLGLDPATNERLRRHLRRHGRDGWKSFSPDVAFDLLYIPDQHERAALVAAYLPYFNVELRSRDIMDIATLRRKHRGRVPQVVQLMGSSGWHHPGVIPRGGAAVDGALVLDVYAGGPGEEFATEEAARFAQGYEAWAGHAPSALTAQAYDAALLVFEARARAAARSKSARGNARGNPRLRFVRALAGAELDSGACGPARLGPSGQIEREAVVLRIDSGSFVLHEY